MPLHEIQGFKVVHLHPSADEEKDDKWLERESKKYPKDDFDREFRLLPVGQTDAYPVFSDYNRQHHEDVRLEYKRGLKYVYRGWDFGKVHPCVEFLQPDGQRINCIYEVYGTNILLTAFAGKVIADSGLYFPGATFVDWGDASGVNERDDGRSSIKVLSDMGIRLRYRREDVEPGLQKMSEGLVQWREGRPIFQLNPMKCPHLAEAMRGGYRRNPKGMLIKDGTHDHPVDATRYAYQGLQVNINAQFSNRPVKEKQPRRPLTDCEAFGRNGRV